MKTNKLISLIAVSDIRIEKTINALRKSSLSLKPLQSILFTSKSIKLSKYDKKIIKIIQIEPINSIKEYSHFIIYKLYKYINTTHIILVQWDGYIFNISKWDDNFLNYDYIGAPLIPRSFDNKYLRDEDGGLHVIGNGGFSLRSKKLLEAASKYKLEDNYEYTNFHEDGFFSVYHRKFLEKKGLIWAPFEVAKKFSIESPLSLVDLKKLPLGFHGKKMLMIIEIINIFNLFPNLLKYIKKIKKNFFNIFIKFINIK